MTTDSTLVDALSGGKEVFNWIFLGPSVKEVWDSVFQNLTNVETTKKGEFASRAFLTITGNSGIGKYLISRNAWMQGELSGLTAGREKIYSFLPKKSVKQVQGCRSSRTGSWLSQLCSFCVPHPPLIGRMEGCCYLSFLVWCPPTQPLGSIRRRQRQFRTLLYEAHTNCFECLNNERWSGQQHVQNICWLFLIKTWHLLQYSLPGLQTLCTHISQTIGIKVVWYCFYRYVTCICRWRRVEHM